MYNTYPNDAMSGIQRKSKIYKYSRKGNLPHSDTAPNKIRGSLFAKSDTHTSNFHVTAKTPSHCQT